MHVEAMSATHAAEVALGKALTLFGTPDRLRAKFWRPSEDFTPVSVLLYERSEEA